jgi:hypothetical protein
MDIGTAKDMITDMHHEINALRREIAHYEKVTNMAYTLAGGHLADCRMGMWCNCGFMLYEAHKEAQK